MTQSTDTPVTIELNPKEQRLYDRLRSRVVEVQPGEGTSIKDLLFLLPDLTLLLMRLLRDDRVPVGGKALAVLGIGYVLSPIDLMPTFLLGPIGLVDDLLILGTTLSRLLNYVHPDVVRSHWSGKGDALDAIQRVTAWSEDQVVGRVRRAVRSLFP